MLFKNPRKLLSEAASADLLDPKVSDEVKDVIDEALYKTTLTGANWNWIPFSTLDAPLRITAKVRYRHTPQPATVYPEADGCARVVFDEPQRAITPGQAVVLYQDDLVVGSATIAEVL